MSLKDDAKKISEGNTLKGKEELLFRLVVMVTRKCDRYIDKGIKPGEMNSWVGERDLLGMFIRSFNKGSRDNKFGLNELLAVISIFVNSRKRAEIIVRFNGHNLKDFSKPETSLIIAALNELYKDGDMPINCKDVDSIRKAIRIRCKRYMDNVKYEL